VFGDFTLRRTASGRREGPPIASVPLDARLPLPASDDSYLLQQWDPALGCEFAFARVGTTPFDVRGLKPPVDSLGRLNRPMAEQVGPLRRSRPLPDPKDEGAGMVVRADGQGVVMRRAAAGPAIEGPRTTGPKANQKRMAVVGAVYSVGRSVRTAEAVLDALFHAPGAGRASGPKRPEPVGKHLGARLTHDRAGVVVDGAAAVFGGRKQEVSARNPSQRRAVVYLMDGQESLWDVRPGYLPWANAEEVRDLRHVAPRRWEAAHLFHPEGRDAAVAFVRGRLADVLRGRVMTAVGGLRQRGTKRGRTGAKRKRRDVICRSLEKNSARMRYDGDVAKGSPSASGVMEGACRPSVKDRLERAGMHWTKAGAQAMLDVRSEYLNGDGEAFHAFRIKREAARLYPPRQVLTGMEWPLAA
jgi:hypothetical protein